MSGNVFLDTNILVYAHSITEQRKHEQAVALLNAHTGKGLFISTQVIAEMYLALQKHGFTLTHAAHVVESCMEDMNTWPITPTVIRRALDIRHRYQYHYWDCQILAAAQLAGCGVVYSEDMQHGQTIGETRIVNPFIE